MHEIDEFASMLALKNFGMEINYVRYVRSLLGSICRLPLRLVLACFV